MGIFSKRKSTPGAIPYHEIMQARSRPKSTGKKTLDVKEWTTQGKAMDTATGPEIIPDDSKFRKTFLSAATRFIPYAKAAVWTWRNLCFTNSTVSIVGGTESQRSEAESLIAELSSKLFPAKYSRSDGFSKLLNYWFLSVFRYGRFAGNIVLTDKFNGVERFEALDPFSILFVKNGGAPYYAERMSEAFQLNKNTFYYFGMDADLENPYGSAMVESAYYLMQIADSMISDMKDSSSNAGTPRLHIKVKQPAILDGETTEKYIDRCNTYFSSTIDEMSELAADDNIYTWSDVEIETVGGQNAQSYVWKANLQIVQEDIVSAFHLFPWVVGKQFGTTKNWVASQFDILMQMVSSIQSEAAGFCDWITNIHLALSGLPQISVKRSFAAPRDISAKEIAIAEQVKLSNIAKKIELGFIDRAAGARELGYTISDKDK